MTFTNIQCQYFYINVPVILLLPMFCNYFFYNMGRHKYETRQSNQLYPPWCKYEVTKQFIKYTGVLVWGTIIDIIDFNLSLTVFKKSIKYYSILINIRPCIFMTIALSFFLILIMNTALYSISSFTLHFVEINSCNSVQI